MPNGVAKTDISCLICCITGRSDNIKRHIQRAHSKQAVPDGWKVAPKNSTVWMKLLADNCKARDGVCLECGVVLKNVVPASVPYVPATFTVFSDHKCKAKQVRDKTVSTPNPAVLKETVKPVTVKETVKPVEDDELPTVPNLSELYDSILDRIDRRPTLSLETKQEVTAVLECLQEDEDYKDDYNMMIELSFITISEKLDGRDKKIAELQQQIRRLDQENWKLKSQIPEPQDELTIVITD